MYGKICVLYLLFLVVVIENAYSEPVDCSRTSTVTLHSQGIENSTLVTRWEVNLPSCDDAAKSTGVIEFTIDSKDTTGASKSEVRNASWTNKTGKLFIVEDNYSPFTEEMEPEAKNPRFINCGCSL